MNFVEAFFSARPLIEGGFGICMFAFIFFVFCIMPPIINRIFDPYFRPNKEKGEQWAFGCSPAFPAYFGTKAGSYAMSVASERCAQYFYKKPQSFFRSKVSTFVAVLCWITTILCFLTLATAPFTLLYHWLPSQ